MISYKDITTDLFDDEQDVDDEGQIVSSRKNRSTLEIIRDQVLPVHEAEELGNWEIMGGLMLQNAQNMNGLIFVTPNERKDLGKLMVEIAQDASVTTLKDAVRIAEHESKKSHFGKKRTSAASKMLQAIRRFSNEAIIFDDVVRKALVDYKRNTKSPILVKDSKEWECYYDGVNSLLVEPTISLGDNNAAISVVDYLKRDEIRRKLAKHSWIDERQLHGLIERRALDRALWLPGAQAGKM